MHSVQCGRIQGDWSVNRPGPQYMYIENPSLANSLREASAHQTKKTLALGELGEDITKEKLYSTRIVFSSPFLVLDEQGSASTQCFPVAARHCSVQSPSFFIVGGAREGGVMSVLPVVSVGA